MLEQPYLDLAQKVLDEGHFKPDRTHTGTYSIFGHQMRFDLSEGFPLLTTKRCPLVSLKASYFGSCVATPTFVSYCSTKITSGMNGPLRSGLPAPIIMVRI